MNKVVKILLNLKKYRHWKKRVAGEEFRDYRKGAGYYFTTGIIGVENIGKIETWDMKSGKRAIFKLIDYRLFSDPDDMIKWSDWQFLGYEGEKRLSEMTFDEFLIANKNQKNIGR